MIPKDEYDKMLKEPFLGSMAQEDFQGFNSEKDGHFIAWSVPSFTKGAVMMALAHYRNLFLM